MMFKPKKNIAGFTLIEALIVGLIMAILSAVAIPLYSGYVQNQEKAAALNLAQTIAVSANSFRRRNGTAPTESQLVAMVFLPDPNRYAITIPTGTTSVKVALKPELTIFAIVPFYP